MWFKMLPLVTNSIFLNYPYLNFTNALINHFYLNFLKFNFFTFFKKTWFKHLLISNPLFNRFNKKKIFKIFSCFTLDNTFINYNLSTFFIRSLKNHKNTIFKYYFFNQLFHYFYINFFFFTNYQYLKLIPFINVKNFLFKKNFKTINNSLRFYCKFNNTNLLVYNNFI
jgi:hypothetical protein